MLTNSMSEEKIKKSIKEYKFIIEEMPFIPNFYKICGSYHAMLKETDQAIEYFQEARAWSPYNYDFLICLGMAYLDKANTSENIDKNKYTNLALKCFNRTPKKHRNYDCYAHRGKAHTNFCNYELAVRDFKEAIRLIQIELGKKKASSDAIVDKWRMCEAYYFLGQTLLLLNKFDEAKSALYTVLSFDAITLKRSKISIVSREKLQKMGVKIPKEIDTLLTKIQQKYS